MTQGAARSQHSQIAVSEALMRVLVDRVERVHQTITKGVGVNIERGMDEMWNIGPIMAIDAVEPQPRAEALALHVEPNLGEAFGRQLGLAPLVMYLLFEGDKRDLADDRVQHVLNLAGEHDLAPAGVRFTREQRSERQHLAEHR